MESIANLQLGLNISDILLEDWGWFLFLDMKTHM